MHAKSLQMCPTLCNPVACQVPLSMGFSRQEYWSVLHALLQGIFLTQGLNLHFFFFFFEPAFPMSPALQALPLAPPGKPSPSISEVYFLIVSGGHLVRDHLLPSLPYLKFTHSPPSTKNQQLLCARHREKGREGKAQASGNSECVYGYLEHSQVNLVPHTVLIMVRT